MPIFEVSTTSRKPPAQPDFAFMRLRLSRWVAFGLGAGLSRTAPGTVGTFLSWALYLLATPLLPPTVLWGVVILGFALGVWACGRAADDLGVADHGAIVWDEIIAFWAVLLLVPSGFGAQFAALLLFRFFDIVKPSPIRQVDQRVKSGFGIMLDDALAAVYAVLTFKLLAVMF